MDISPNLHMPYLMAAQAQKHITHNQALQVLDALVQLSVLSKTLDEPPSSPANGDRYIVAETASGAWDHRQGQVAAYQDEAWAFHPPQQGWLAWVADEESLEVFNGERWQGVSADTAQESIDRLGINATADDTNRLSVNAQATLFNHDGQGHRFKINKKATTDTASLLYQTGFSGRAEMGLSGDDDFHVKVSPDGSTFHEALVVDRNSGAVSFPNTEILGGGDGGLAQHWRSTRDPRVGWMTHGARNLASVSRLNTAVFAPLMVGNDGDFSMLNVYCQSGASGQSLRAALYHAAPDNLAGKRVQDFGSVSLDQPGMKTLSTSAISLSKGLYYVALQTTSSSPTFRGGNVVPDHGAGIMLNIIHQVGIGAITYLAYATPWPLDLTEHTIGKGNNQVDLPAALFCPNSLLR